mgnify:FL=1|jgi:uncharacterized protein (DUF1778 family)
MASLALKKDARLDLKTTQQNKELLAQAALLRGVDMTSFIIEPALKAARQVIEQAQLQHSEQVALFRALSKPAQPTEELKDLLSAGTFSER